MTDSFIAIPIYVDVVVDRLGIWNTGLGNQSTCVDWLALELDPIPSSEFSAALLTDEWMIDEHFGYVHTISK